MITGTSTTKEEQEARHLVHCPPHRQHQHDIASMAQHSPLPRQPSWSDTVLNPSQSEPGNPAASAAEDKQHQDQAPRYCVGPDSG